MKMTSCLRSLTKMQSPDAFSEVEQTSGYRQGNLSSLGSTGMERDSGQPWGLARGAFQDPRVTQGFAVLQVGGAARVGFRWSGKTDVGAIGVYDHSASPGRWGGGQCWLRALSLTTDVNPSLWQVDGQSQH